MSVTTTVSAPSNDRAKSRHSAAVRLYWCGWKTQIGPGRHPISSAYFWYVNCPAGGLAEYYADEDWCTEAWQAKAWYVRPAKRDWAPYFLRSARVGIRVARDLPEAVPNPK